MQKKPKLGQHFLVSATAPAAIVRALGDSSSFLVVEIGPGRAVITDLLARSAEQLIAVEYDRRLVETLTLRYASFGNVEILSADILATDLTALAQRAGRKLLILGNLPYYITSDILLHLFAHHAVITRAVLMVQREMADRITAVPGTSDYGLLSATTQLYARTESLFTLPPSDFSPPPDVYSTVIRLVMEPKLFHLSVEPDVFVPFLRKCFAQKRKTLANNLRTAEYEGAAVALTQCGLDLAVRAEAVPLEQMACLFHHFHPSQQAYM